MGNFETCSDSECGKLKNISAQEEAELVVESFELVDAKKRIAELEAEVARLRANEAARLQSLFSELAAMRDERDAARREVERLRAMNADLIQTAENCGRRIVMLENALANLRNSDGCWCDRYYDPHQCGHQDNCREATEAAKAARGKDEH